MNIVSRSTFRRGWWRVGLLGVAGLLGAAVLALWMFVALVALLAQLRGHPLVELTNTVPLVEVLANLLWLVVAVGVLGCAILAEGRQAMGLRTGGLARGARALGGYIYVTVVAEAACTVLVRFVLVPGLGWAGGVGNNGLDTHAVPYAFIAFHALAVGVAEEVIVLALAWCLLEHLPWRPWGRPFVATGLATALLVGLRLSYHAYLGVAILPIVAWAWLTVRFYRHNRMLLPIILAHIAHNMAVPTRIGGVFYLGIGLLLLAITNGPDSGVYFGFHSRKHPRPPAPTHASSGNTPHGAAHLGQLVPSDLDRSEAQIDQQQPQPNEEHSQDRADHELSFQAGAPFGRAGPGRCR